MEGRGFYDMPGGEEHRPKFTNEDYILKAKKFLSEMVNKYTDCWKDDPTEDECGRCGGMLYIEQGGVSDVDCPSCNGTGRNNERVFDTDEFMEYFEHTGLNEVIDLAECEILPPPNKNTSPTKPKQTEG